MHAVDVVGVEQFGPAGRCVEVDLGICLLDPLQHVLELPAPATEMQASGFVHFNGCAVGARHWNVGFRHGQTHTTAHAPANPESTAHIGQ